MKRKLFIAAMVGLAVLLGFSFLQISQGQAGRLPTQMRTVTYPSVEIGYWNDARGSSGVSADDATPDPNSKTWTAYEAGTYFNLSDRTEHYTLSFYAYGDGNDHDPNDPNGGVWDVNVYLVDRYSSWSRIGSFGVTVGELELTHNPVTGLAFNGGALEPNEAYKAADVFTTALSADIWTDANDIEGETNGWGRFNFKSHGAYGVVVLIDNISDVEKVYPIIKPR
jgi:hypothetical protein